MQGWRAGFVAGGDRSAHEHLKKHFRGHPQTSSFGERAHCCGTASVKSKMWPLKPDKPLSQLVGRIETKFQWQKLYVFEVQLSNETISIVVLPNLKYEI